MIIFRENVDFNLFNGTFARNVENNGIRTANESRVVHFIVRKKKKHHVRKLCTKI